MQVPAAGGGRAQDRHAGFAAGGIAGRVTAGAGDELQVGGQPEAGVEGPPGFSLAVDCAPGGLLRAGRERRAAGHGLELAGKLEVQRVPDLQAAAPGGDGGDVGEGGDQQLPSGRAPT